MVCGGLRWFSRFLRAHGHTDVLSSQILVVVCGGLRWCVVVCGGLWWFAVVCGGLWWIAVVCLLVIPVKSREADIFSRPDNFLHDTGLITRWCNIWGTEHLW